MCKDTFDTVVKPFQWYLGYVFTHKRKTLMVVKILKRKIRCRQMYATGKLGDFYEFDRD